MTPLDIALHLAATGWPVFPCGPNKRPSIPKSEGGHGFLDATTDATLVRRMFAHRNAALVGVPTGEVSGIDILDIDPRHGGEAWEAENRHRLPETRIHATMSGGRHWLFIHAPGVRNSAGKEGLALGVDVRGTGGYAVWPNSKGYSVVSNAPVAHWPDWLLQPGMVLPKARPCPSKAATLGAVSERVIKAKLQAALDRVRNAGNGQKHFTLRNMALLLGGIAEKAGLSDSYLAGHLFDALPDTVEDWQQARGTIAWGLEHGRANPIDLDREQPARLGAPDPRHRAIARSACRMLRGNVAGADILRLLHEENRALPDPLASDAVIQTVRWAAKQIGGASHER